MYEDYDDDEDEYDDDQYDYDHPSANPYYYFKFDVSADSPLSKWLTDMFSNIDYWNQIESIVSGFPVFSVPVNSWNPNAGKDNSFQYLGSNYYGQQVWKKKYFISDPINQEYKLHIQAHAKHFVLQPDYYGGLFEILN